MSTTTVTASSAPATPMTTPALSTAASTTSTDLPSPVLGSLSPSRAADFMTCPLLFRFRTIDRLPQAPSSAATRGTVVHAVLERLYDLPAGERTLQAAADMLRPEWDRLREADPTVEALFGEEADLAAWLAGARELLAGYFSLEDPTRLEPAERERLVEVVLPGACGCAASWTGSTGRRAAT
jgi:putative RecB family exonuclease